MPDDAPSSPHSHTSLQSKPLTILFRDEWIIAVDKPAGQLVHPADVPVEGDMVTMKILRDQIGARVHLIHRLDRPTSGVVVFATDGSVARKLHQAFAAHEVQKIYWAVIDGHPAGDAWTCTEPMRKDETAPERPAETHFRVVERLTLGLALVEARPRTGRFHQIRRHLLHAGHPIVGDYRYLGIERCDALGASLGTGARMLLQARSLQFHHPATGEIILIESRTDPLIDLVRKRC